MNQLINGSFSSVFSSAQQGKMFLFIGLIMILVQGGYVRRIAPGKEKQTTLMVHKKDEKLLKKFDEFFFAEKFWRKFFCWKNSKKFFI